MTPPAVWPKMDPKLSALADAVDAFLSGVLPRDELARAWRVAKGYTQ